MMVHLRKGIVTGLFLLMLIQLQSQSPIISHVEPVIGRTGQQVTLTGNNFGTNASNLAVYFGAAKADILAITNQLLEVSVPAGATFEPITVTHLPSGLTAASENPFLLSYGGQHPFPSPATALGVQQDLNSESGLYDLCLCDLDGDGKTDISASHDKDGATKLALFLNNSSTAGAISYAAYVPFVIGSRSVHIRCGDLNGDGKKDLVASEGGSGNNLRLFILKNTSTVGNLTFVQQTITLSGKSPKRIEIEDMDMDGRPELIITDQRSGNNDLIILPNTSSTSTISFGSAITLTIPGTGQTNSDGLAVQDVNGDHLPDIVTNQFLSANSNVFIFANRSTSGNLRFDDAFTLTLGGTPVNMRLGDLDGDGKADLAVTQLLGSTIALFRNQSTPEALSFAAPQSVATDFVPWGLDLADLDGDKKADIVIASLTNTTVNPKSLTILNNTSTGVGSFSFLRQTVPTTFVNRHINLGDLDGDGKPDIAFTSVDDINRGDIASKISIIRNKACLVPVITPEGPHTVCSSFPFALEASISAGATYQWLVDGVAIPLATNSSFSPTLLGSHNYTVELTSTADGCTKTSAAVQVTVVATGTAIAPVVTANSPICNGASLTLGATSGGASNFEWTGPADFTFSDPSGNASRANFQLEHAGKYEVNVIVGSGSSACVAAKGSVMVEALSIPNFRVGFTGSPIVCTGDVKILNVTPTDTNFTYQWFDDNGEISGATNSTFSVNASGNYHFEATSVINTGCGAVSNIQNILVVTLPVAAFQSPAVSCVGTAVAFSNQSTFDPAATPTYAWDFGDAGTSTQTNPTHAFNTVSDFTVKLTVSYAGNTCPVQITKSINIGAAPTASITNPDDGFQFCEGDSLELGVNASFDSYLWSSTETTSVISIKQGGTFSVELTNSAGCKVTPTKIVTMLAAPVITASATPAQINLGETTSLTATSGLLNYLWAPEEPITEAGSDPGIATPQAIPQETTLFTVVAEGTNGCFGQATVEVVVTQENVINLIKPSNFFSPNSADDINPVWEVRNILSFQQCGVKVFDEKGMMVFHAQPYDNNWDGTYNGKPLPSGVYFYVIQCEGEGESKTGSITLLR